MPNSRLKIARGLTCGRRMDEGSVLVKGSLQCQGLFYEDTKKELEKQMWTI